MRRASLLLASAAALVLAALAARLDAQAVKQPVYVGARACAECHEGHAAGNQYSLWLQTAHSKAWASLATLPLRRLELIADVWADRYRELGKREDVEYVFEFENRGVEVGVTLHHPHGQIYAYPFINVPDLGWPGVLATCAVIAVAFVIAGLGLVVPTR